MLCVDVLYLVCDEGRGLLLCVCLSTSPAYVSNNSSHPADLHGRLAQHMSNRAPSLEAMRINTILSFSLGGLVLVCQLVCCVFLDHYFYVNNFIRHLLLENYKVWTALKLSLF